MNELAHVGALPTQVQQCLVAALATLWAGLESDETRRAYRQDWTKFSAFLVAAGADPLTAGPLELAAYFEHLRARGLARSTRARALSVAREVFGAIYRAGLRPDNPAREMKLPRVHHEPRTPWLTEEQLIALLRPCGDSWVARRNRLLLFMLVGMALRRTSAARPRVEDLIRRPDGRLGLRVLGKGAKTADLLLPVWLAHEIEAWIAYSGVTGPLFPRLRRVGYNDIRPDMERAIGAGKVWSIVKEAAKRAGIAEQLATPHALRRSFATISRTRGVALADLQAALMHSRSATTELYDRALRGMKSAPGDVLVDIYESASSTTDGKDQAR